jgi:predicted ABC-type transport system involved in lysophospholipase L1 biosynthesis ATPase subunit
MRPGNLDDTNKIQRYASIIYKENKRLENQVEKVLNVAKLDKEQIVLKNEKIDLQEILKDIKENFEFYQEIRGGKIKLNYEAENSKITGDLVHITNVLFNLIDNAAKYCDNQPHIEISTKSDNKYVSVTIIDNGIGIAKENLSHIFDKFYRVPGTPSGGTGIGLAIARAIVNNPVMILGDEPTGNLDTRTSEEIMAVFQDVNRQGRTVIIVTHEEDVANHCKRIIRFRDGRIQSDEAVANPVDAREIIKTLPDPDAEVAVSIETVAAPEPTAEKVTFQI